VRLKLSPEFRRTPVNATRLLVLTVQNQNVPSLPTGGRPAPSPPHGALQSVSAVITNQEDARASTSCDNRTSPPTSSHGRTSLTPPVVCQQVRERDRRTQQEQYAFCEECQHAFEKARQIGTPCRSSFADGVVSLTSSNTFSSSDNPELPNKDSL